MAKRDEPRKDGVRTTAAEKERRLAFVEQLIIAGKAQSVEQVRGLMEEGLKVSIGDTAARNYIAEAENRIGQASEKTKAARREYLWRLEMESLRRMFDRLRNQNVEPTWENFGAALERAFNRYCPKPHVDFEADAAPVVAADSPEAKSDPELEKLLSEMLETASRG